MERELWRWDAVELAAAIRTRKVSSREAVQSVLERLEAVNPAINAVTVDPAKQFERYPIVVGPVSTEPPFAVGFDVESAQKTREVLRCHRLLVAVNLLGLPAVSVPTGLWGGLPLGVQVIGARYREDLCLDAAEVIEAQRGLPTPIDPAG